MAETKPKARELGKDSNGDPALYPSDIEAVATQYGLTTAEAEALIVAGTVSEAAASKAKKARSVNVPVTKEVPAEESHPLTAAESKE